MLRFSLIASGSKERVVLSNSHDYVRPASESERAYLESLVRDDFERAHPGETFDDMKCRAPFSREDKGLYRDWLAVAVERADRLAVEESVRFAVAAE